MKTTIDQPKTIVTKQKSPGRVAAGKKLAEYNKRNKEQKQKIKEEPEQEIKEPEQIKEVEQIKESEETETSNPYINYIFLGGLGLLSFGYIYKKFLQVKKVEPKEEVKTKEDKPVVKCNKDPFYME